MKVKELLAWLKKNGWVLDRVRGSHHVFRHKSASRSLPVPVHGKDISDNFAKAIMKQAQKALEE